MMCPQVVDGGDSHQIWKVAANMLNKQSRTLTTIRCMEDGNKYVERTNKNVTDLSRGISELKKGYKVREWCPLEIPTTF
jgi:hypothetical protein